MTQSLKPEQFKRIIELVAPHMSSDNRSFHITPWCLDHEALYGRIQWAGADRAFTIHVVELFLKHGQIEPNKSALHAFLESVREDMGQQDQAEIDNILQEIQSAGNNTGNNLAPKPLPPQSQRATHFTGRDAILADLCQALQPGKMVALCGPGGIGKTTLALEAVYSLLDDDQLDQRFPDGVLFHSFYDEKETDLALDNLLRQLGEQPLPPLATHAQRVFTQRQLLLILDGAEDATDLSAVLKVRGNSGVLITTRERRDTLDCNLCLNVQPLPNTDAVDLLLQFVDPGSCDAETAQAICQRVGNLPLAVQLVGRDMVQNGLLGQEFLQWLQQTPLEVLDQGQRRQESIPILLDRSLAGISEAARNALALIGQLALAPVDSALLAPALEQLPAQMPRLLGELVNLSILRRDANGRYSVSHALIHTYASLHMMPSNDRLARLGQAYANFVEVQSALKSEGNNRLDQERVHLLAVTHSCANAELWSVVDILVSGTEDYLKSQGHWEQRIRLLWLGILSAEKLSNRRNEGTYLGKLGLTYSDLGRRSEAIDHFEKALTIALEIGDRSGKGEAFRYLGIECNYLGQKSEAINYFEKALTITQEIGDRKNEGYNLGCLGHTYRELVQKPKAIDYYKQALDIAQEVGDHRGKGAWLGGLGGIYRSSRQEKEAIDCYEEALTISREIGERNSEGRHLGNLGNVYNDFGKASEAINYYKQALTIAQEISDRSSEGVYLGNLGFVYRNLGRVTEAIKYYEQARTISQETDNRNGEGRSLGNLGNAYRDLGRVSKAIDYYEQARTISQETSNRSSEGTDLINLGRANAMLDNGPKAISFCQQGLDIHIEIGNRTKEGDALNYLGYSYGVTGQWNRAIELHLEAIEIQEKINSRYQLGHTWNDLGEAYVATDQFTEAESAFDQALTLAQEVGNRWGEAQCQWNRGLLYERQGKMAEAVAAMQVCADYFQEIGHVEADERVARLVVLVGEINYD